MFPTRNPDISFVSFVDVDLVWDVSWVRCDGYVWGCEMLWYSWWCMMTVWVMVLSRHVLVWVIIMLCDMSIIYYIYVRCDMYYLGYWWYSCWVGCDTWVIWCGYLLWGVTAGWYGRLFLGYEDGISDTTTSCWKMISKTEIYYNSVTFERFITILSA